MTAPGPAAALRAALAHRYRFEGTGVVATDEAGGAHGELQGTTLDGAGFVSLSGGSFVDLPNGILSARDDATLETWIVYNGGVTAQRIFDFGSSDAGEGAQGSGSTYLFLSPDWGEGHPQGGMTTNGVANVTWIDGGATTPVGTLAHLAMVVDGSEGEVRLYLDGRPDGTTLVADRLSSVNDVNVWLGRPQVAGHPNLNAEIHEFRLYAAALSDALVASSFQLGPDAPELD